MQESEYARVSDGCKKEYVCQCNFQKEDINIENARIQKLCSERAMESYHIIGVISVVTA